MSSSASGGAPFFIVVLYLFYLSFAPLYCNAQATTNATCSSAFQWMFNSKKQSPCLVAAFLGGSCNDGTFNVPALDGDHYIGPTDETVTACQCSSVMYSMMSACAACQNATFLTWDDWSNDCTFSVVGDFDGIPPQTAVPSWAFDDVTVNGTFDVLTAESKVNGPESSAFDAGGATQTFDSGAAPTDAPFQGSPVSGSGNGNPNSNGPATSASPNGPGSGNSTGVNGTNQSGSTSGGKGANHTAAIAGAVVGVVVVPAVIGAVVFLVVRNKKKRVHVAPSAEFMTHTPIMSPTSPTEIKQTTAIPYTYSPPTPPNATSDSLGPQVLPAQPVMSQPIMQPFAPPRFYNPDDPSTFPKTPIPKQRTGQSSLSANTDEAQNFSYTSTYPYGMGTEGAYTGAPEL